MADRFTISVLAILTLIGCMAVIAIVAGIAFFYTSVNESTHTTAVSTVSPVTVVEKNSSTSAPDLVQDLTPTSAPTKQPGPGPSAPPVSTPMPTPASTPVSTPTSTPGNISLPTPLPTAVPSLSPIPAPASIVWARTYGGAAREEGHSVLPTADGGYVMAGGTVSSGHGLWSIYVVKADRDGNMLWNNTTSDAKNINAYGILPDDWGGYFIAGATESPSNGLWDVYEGLTYDYGSPYGFSFIGGKGSELAYAAARTTDRGYSNQGYVMAGTTNSFGQGYYDMYIVKVSASGGQQWTATYGFAVTDDQAFGIQQTEDGGYIVSGFTRQVSSGSRKVLLVKMDSSGVEQWNRTFDGVTGEDPVRVVLTDDGGYLVVGQGTVIKTDDQGNWQWQKSYGPTRTELLAVTKASNGGYVVAGHTDGRGNGSWDYYIAGIDDSGNLLWDQTAGGPADEFAYDVKETNDGCFVVLGYTTSYGSGGDFYLVKFQPSVL